MTMPIEVVATIPPGMIVVGHVETEIGPAVRQGDYLVTPINRHYSVLSVILFDPNVPPVDVNNNRP